MALAKFIMKPYHHVLLTVLTVSALAVPSLPLRAEPVNTPMRLGNLEKASTIIGREVKNSQDQRLGKVHDLAIQLGTGRVLEVIVSTGGFLDVHEKMVALPPSKFSYDAADKTLRLNVEQSQLRDAPVFEMSHWRDNTQEAARADVYQRYGATVETQEQPGEGRTAIQRASKVIGMRAHNQQDENLGKVENILVDLPAGRIVEVVLATGGFLGMGDELSEAPPQSFRYTTEKNRLVLETSRETLAHAPHFKSSEWPNVNNPGHYGAVYSSYNVSPYFATNQADNSAQNERDRSGDTLTPQNQRNNKSDVAITRSIRKQIIATKDLSVDARNVKIVTVDGHVTLRGPVNNEDERHLIGTIAARVVPAENIDNELQPKNRPTAENSNQ